MELDSPHSLVNRQRIEGLLVILFVIIVAFVVVYFYPNLPQTPNTPIAITATSTEPTRTDFGTASAPDFPSNIPVEQGVKVNQSYSLDYSGQKQLTIVFSTTKTVKQNYNLYADFLKKDGWAIANKYESVNVSSLYGTKQSNDINVTITKEQVSISVLKK